jgi:hypothetical protein
MLILGLLFLPYAAACQSPTCLQRLHHAPRRLIAEAYMAHLALLHCTPNFSQLIIKRAARLIRLQQQAAAGQSQ